MPCGSSAARGVDQALDLPPVAEFEDVLRLAALFGAHGGLQRRLAAELADQVLGVGKAVAAGDEEVSMSADYQPSLAAARTNGVNKRQPWRTGLHGPQFGNRLARRGRRDVGRVRLLQGRGPARVRPLVEALEADGLSVWWDAHIGGGDEWRETIARHLDEARCVIVVWSKRSIGPEGRFVRDEATRALRRHAYLPVRIDKVDPPLGFGETQALPLSGWKGNRSDPRYRPCCRCSWGISGSRRPHRARLEGQPSAAADRWRCSRSRPRRAEAAGCC